MNKTVSINIGGIIFNVNEDAYIILKDYLDELFQYFSKTEEGKEVYSDIEGRIAEIFSEIITGKNQVITMKDVENVIATLGKIEDLIDSDTTEETSSGNKKTKKRLYRDIDDKAFAGVAKGLSYYFGIEVAIVRIIFVLLAIFGGSGIWIYIILWIAMPEAKTTVQKMEMKGDPINLSNLDKKIKDEFNHVKENIKDKEYHKDIHSFFEKTFDFFITIFKGLFKALSKIIGLIFIVLGIIFLSSIVSTFLFDNTLIQINEFGIEAYSLKSILYFFTTDANISWIFLSILLLIGIPILFLLYFGIKLIFGIKFNSKIISIVFTIFWIFGIVILVSSIIDISQEFKKKNQLTKQTDISIMSDTLYLKNVNVIDKIDSDKYVFYDNDDDFIVAGEKIYLKPELDIIENNKDTTVKIKVIYFSRGRNKSNAKENNKNIYYQWKQQADTLLLNSHYIINKQFRNQEVKIKIYKPKNKVIVGEF